MQDNSSVPDVPPWEPIADWLARLLGTSCDDEHEDTRLTQNATQNELRKRYEKTAKAIAYDIAVDGTERIDPEQMQRELIEDTRERNMRGDPIEVCPKCEGHGGVPSDVCEACGGSGRADGKSNL